MTGYAGSRDYMGILCGLLITSNSLLPAQNSCERVGVCFFSGMCGSVWGLLRTLRGPYVIPRPGVLRHILGDHLNMVVFFWYTEKVTFFMVPEKHGHV